eukprot:scaffold593129_cov17-Prasinocladus_malaysianus.AAC.1
MPSCSTNAYVAVSFIGLTCSKTAFIAHHTFPIVRGCSVTQLVFGWLIPLLMQTPKQKRMH